jgi:isocitrate/isopropylmalate dehydrogenase
MMLDHLGEADAAERVRAGVISAIVSDGIRTRDLGGHATTREFGEAVAARVAG